MKNLIEILKKNNVFFLILFGLYVAGLCDFISTQVCLSTGLCYEANFYIPFLSTQAFTLVLVANHLLLKGNWFIVSGCVVVLCSLLPLVNNLNVYISV